MLQPNTFVLGAAKCGTTSLAALMGEHPQIFVPEIKEVRYFSRDEYFERGPQFYDSFFANAAAPIVVDASPQYLYYHQKVIPRLQAHYGSQAKELRFVVLLRNPVRRAYSAYWQARRFGMLDGSFEEALRDEASALGDPGTAARGQTAGLLVAPGEYAPQLRAWFDAFDRSQFHVFLSEDIWQSADEAYLDLWRFLDVAPHQLETVGRVRNPASVARSNAVARVLYEPSRVKEIAKAIVPEPIRHRVKRVVGGWNRKRIEVPQMPAHTVTWLEEKFRDDIRETGALLGRDLSGWIHAVPSAANPESDTSAVSK